jgi:RNA polymerase sigma-70 factor, ECF subfamily
MCDMNYLQLPDNELLTLLARPAHQQGAFAALYDRYSQRVLIYCSRALGSEDGRDVFQETFVRFFNSTQSTASIDNIPALLLTIARNLCLNHKRNRKATITLEEFDYHAPAVASAHTHDAQLEQDDLLRLIELALEYLDFEYREAFVLRQYNNLSYEEIAHITGASIPTVTNRIWRAKERIKKILAPYVRDVEQS